MKCRTKTLTFRRKRFVQLLRALIEQVASPPLQGTLPRGELLKLQRIVTMNAWNHVKRVSLRRGNCEVSERLARREFCRTFSAMCLVTFRPEADMSLPVARGHRSEEVGKYSLEGDTPRSYCVAPPACVLYYFSSLQVGEGKIHHTPTAPRNRTKKPEKYEPAIKNTVVLSTKLGDFVTSPLAAEPAAKRRDPRCKRPGNRRLLRLIAGWLADRRPDQRSTIDGQTRSPLAAGSSCCRLTRAHKARSSPPASPMSCRLPKSIAWESTRRHRLVRTNRPGSAFYNRPPTPSPKAPLQSHNCS